MLDINLFPFDFCFIFITITQITTSKNIRIMTAINLFLEFQKLIF